MSIMDKKPLLGLSLSGLREVAAECGLPRFAAGQMARWLYVKRVESVGEMTDISLEGRRRLDQAYCVGRTAPKASACSADGTVKYLFDGAGGRDIESVYIPDRDRATLCVSSQAGCRMGCTFCMTGRQGFYGNLTAARIINQIMAIPESGSLTNIVFMGMGEPTDNLEAVIAAIEILTEPWGMAWSPKRITVSSVGNIPGMRRLIEQTKVHIALSVHTPFPTERQGIMPVERAFAVRNVMEMLRGYDFAHQRRLSVEYIMWRGFNDDDMHAIALARLLRGTGARVNLIRYHAIDGDTSRQPSSKSTMEAFRDKLNSLGITATIRASRGEDIDAACGMLAGKDQSKEQSE